MTQEKQKNTIQRLESAPGPDDWKECSSTFQRATSPDPSLVQVGLTCAALRPSPNRRLPRHRLRFWWVMVCGRLQQQIWRWFRSWRKKSVCPQQFQPSSPLWPDCWLVVKSANLFAVQRALELQNPKPCSWVEGFADADRLFVAPPVKGWVLIAGAGLIPPSEDVDACFYFLSGLARKLDCIQFFNLNRTLLFHSWVKAEHGRIVRAYAWAGLTLWQQGRPTRAETELKLGFLDYAQPIRSSEQEHMLKENTEKVPLLAARWGLDLARVQEHLVDKDLGVSGVAPHPR